MSMHGILRVAYDLGLFIRKLNINQFIWWAFKLIDKYIFIIITYFWAALEILSI